MDMNNVLSHLEQCEVVSLENSPALQSSKYRFEWIPENPKSKKSQHLSSHVSTSNINLPLGHFLSSSRDSSIDSKIAYGDKGTINNSPVTPIRYEKTTNDLSRRNKSYTVVNITFDKQLQKSEPTTLVKYKKINIIDEPQNKNNNCNLVCNVQKNKGIDDYSSSALKNEKVNVPIECVKPKKPAEGCTITKGIEQQIVKENTSVTRNDLKYESEISEDDNEFLIAFLNDQQLEIKTFSI